MKDDLSSQIPHLRGYARSLCRDDTAADDLVQETLMKAIANKDRFQPGTNLRAWLFTILRNSFITDVRKKVREQPLPEEADSFLPGQPGSQDASMDFRDFVRALHCLRRDFREALLLIGAAGFSYEEAAGIAGCRIGTIKSRVSRARSELRCLLEKGRKLPTESEALPTFREVSRTLQASSIH